MNTKRLYSADGYAVKEMLKVTTLLYGATRPDVAAELESAESSSEISFDVSSRVSLLAELEGLHRVERFTHVKQTTCATAG